MSEPKCECPNDLIRYGAHRNGCIWLKWWRTQQGTVRLDKALITPAPVSGVAVSSTWLPRQGDLVQVVRLDTAASWYSLLGRSVPFRARLFWGGVKGSTILMQGRENDGVWYTGTDYTVYWLPLDAMPLCSNGATPPTGTLEPGLTRLHPHVVLADVAWASVSGGWKVAP